MFPFSDFHFLYLFNCVSDLWLFPLFFPLTLPSSLFLASGVPVLLIMPYLWSNLAATAWVSVARRAVPLSRPAVAEINPPIEQSRCWPLQTPKSHYTPTLREIRHAKFWMGYRTRQDRCVCMCVKDWECVGSGWIEWAKDGQGRGIKMADWACLYF